MQCGYCHPNNYPFPRYHAFHWLFFKLLWRIDEIFCSCGRKTITFHFLLKNLLPQTRYIFERDHAAATTEAFHVLQNQLYLNNVKHENVPISRTKLLEQLCIYYFTLWLWNEIGLHCEMQSYSRSNISNLTNCNMKSYMMTCCVKNAEKWDQNWR